MKSAAFTLSFVILFIFTLSAQKINKPLPSCKLKTLDGKTVELKDQLKSGRLTVVVFWATWCSPCKKQMGNIDELLDDWSKKYKADVIAISIDDARNASKVKPYVDGRGYDFLVLLDTNSDTKHIFNYVNIPFSAIIDQNKNIVYLHNGYVEGDEYQLEKVIKELSQKK